MKKSKMKRLQELCHKIAIEKGFWEKCKFCLGSGKMADEIEAIYTLPRIKFKYIGKKIKCTHCEGKGYSLDRNNAEMLMLMVSELGEACEGLRKDDWKNVGEELADCVIRIMDFAEGRNIDLEKEILKKIEKNKKRKLRHGKKF